MDYFILAGIWFFYFMLHSFLASVNVKSFFERAWKDKFRYYRFTYSLISIIGLALLLFFNASLSSDVIFISNGVVRYLSLMLATLGVIVISRSFREYRFSSFIGLEHEGNEFIRTGILKHVRHPIYSGTILIVIGFFLFNPTWGTLVSACCILFYLPIGIYLEERKLIAQFGDQYLRYKKEVPSILPTIKRSSFKEAS